MFITRKTLKHKFTPTSAGDIDSNIPLPKGALILGVQYFGKDLAGGTSLTPKAGSTSLTAAIALADANKNVALSVVDSVAPLANQSNLVLTVVGTFTAGEITVLVDYVVIG